jgi:hypothetical protein
MNFLLLRDGPEEDSDAILRLLAGQGHSTAEGNYALAADPRTCLIYCCGRPRPEQERQLARARGPVLFRVPALEDPAGRVHAQGLLREHPYAAGLPQSPALWWELGLEMIPQRTVFSLAPRPLPSAGVLPHDGILGYLSGPDVHLLASIDHVPPARVHRLFEVLREFRALCQTGVVLHLWSAAPGYDATALFASVSASRLLDCVDYSKDLPPPQLLAFYLGCDAYLCSDPLEAFSPPALEARRWGLPVVAASCAAAAAAELLRWARHPQQRGDDPRFLPAAVEADFLSAVSAFTGESL